MRPHHRHLQQRSTPRSAGTPACTSQEQQPVARCRCCCCLMLLRRLLRPPLALASSTGDPCGSSTPSHHPGPRFVVAPRASTSMQPQQQAAAVAGSGRRQVVGDHGRQWTHVLWSWVCARARCHAPPTRQPQLNEGLSNAPLLKPHHQCVFCCF